MVMRLLKGYAIPIKIATSILILLYFYLTIDIPKFTEILSELGVNYIPLIIALIFARILSAAARFRLLISSTKISLLTLTKHFFIAAFFNNILPTAIGGDAARVVLLHKEGISKKASASYIIIDRFIGLFSLISISFLLLFFIPFPVELRTYIVAAMAITTVLGIAFYLFRKKIIDRNPEGNLLMQSINAFFTVPMNKGNLLLSMLVSYLNQLIAIYTSYVIALAVNIEIDFTLFLFIIPLVSLVVMLPISFGGLGVREASFVYLFSFFAVPAENAFFISLGTYVTLIVAGLIGSLVMMYDHVYLKSLLASSKTQPSDNTERPSKPNVNQHQ